MSTGAERHDGRPWYREVWPWLLMLPPAAAVAGGVMMIVLATTTPAALVVDDYARIEQLTNERFERDRLASEYGLSATLSFGDSPARLEISLAGGAELALPPALLLGLRHATNPAADREIVLTRTGEAYRAEVIFLPGRYYVELMPADRSWRLGGNVTRFDGAITLRPQGDAGAVAPAGRSPDPGDAGD